MTHTLNNSMAVFIPECNISFNGGDLSSDTGAILPLDFINSNLNSPLYTQVVSEFGLKDRITL